MKNHVDQLSAALQASFAAEPGLAISFDAYCNKAHIGLWFDTAVGKEYVVAFQRKDEPLADTFARADELRAAKIAEAIVEAQVRAEVAERMAKAA